MSEKQAQGEAVLMVGDTLTSPDIRHVLPVMVPDPLIYLEQAGKRVVYTNSLDSRVIGELPDVDVQTFDDLGASFDASEGTMFSPYRGPAVRACQAQGVSRAIVPPQFPLAIAQAVEAAGVEVVVEEVLFSERRRVKSPAEVKGAIRASRAAEAGWDVIRETLRSDPSATSEQLRARVYTEVSRHDVIPYDMMIVSHGPQVTNPHSCGSGAVRESESVVADLVMRDRETGVYADVTRTFCVGDVPDKLAQYFALCQEAMAAAMGAVKAGVVAEDLDAAAMRVFEDAGMPTRRNFGTEEALMEEGSWHGLGHGVGLQVHEAPLLVFGSKAELLAGEILCLEPGLYREGFGGCRLEDMVLVTESGCEPITEYEYSLEP